MGAVRADLDREASGRRSEVRWVRLEGLHVTLRFLGATDAERAPSIASAIERAVANRPAFEVTVAGAGAFPSAARPRTLWLALPDGRDGLAGLARSVDDELVALGWPRSERPFRAHLTLARADGRREGPRAARLLATHAATLEVGFRVDRVVLFESVTGGGPARYVPLHTVELRGGGGGREVPE